MRVLGEASWLGGLAYLGLSDCGLADGAVAVLAALPLRALRALDLSHARAATPRALRALAHVPWAPQLVRLDLSGCSGAGRDPAAWAELAAAPLRSLLVLRIEGAGLCAAGARALRAAE